MLTSVDRRTQSSGKRHRQTSSQRKYETGICARDDLRGGSRAAKGASSSLDRSIVYNVRGEQEAEGICRDEVNEVRCIDLASPRARRPVECDVCDEQEYDIELEESMHVAQHVRYSPEAHEATLYAEDMTLYEPHVVPPKV